MGHSSNCPSARHTCQEQIVVLPISPVHVHSLGSKALYWSIADRGHIKNPSMFFCCVVLHSWLRKAQAMCMCFGHVCSALVRELTSNMLSGQVLW